MNGGQQFNEETSRKVEALYLTPDVVARRCQVLKTLELREDELVLDIIASFAVGRKGVSREETDGWLAEFASLGKQGKFFFSLNRYLFVADKLAAT